MAYQTKPTVTLVSHTAYDDPGIMSLDPDLDPTSALHLIEFAGRSCYQSFDKPNPDTRANDAYIENISSQRHFSVLEHANISLYLQGVSRNLTHELVRHRHFSFSELSGRYVDANQLGFVVHPSLEGTQAEKRLIALQDVLWQEYNLTLQELAAKGVKGKKAREAARNFFGGNIETRIVVTGNLRTWLEAIDKRDHPAADAEMQQVAGLIHDILRELYPAVFTGADVGKSQEAPKI